MTLSSESGVSAESDDSHEAGYDIGVQSVVFQSLSLAELLAELDSVGVEYLELWDAHLSPDDDEETIQAALAAIEESGVTICGYGVVDLTEPGQAGAYFALADRLGATYLTVNYPPDSDEITEEVIDHAEAFDIDVAIHNYSTVHHDDVSSVFSSIEDVDQVLECHAHPKLGVCIDTGHFLVMDEAPEDVIEALGPSIVAVHLKDTSETELEDLPGAGRLDLPHVLSLLEAYAEVETPLIIEYELPAERATAALEEAVENIRRAVTQ
ncbi:sugar phosphate isomerase/epimerase family protein [Natronobiforma cellulositropha]|uniref:sugar phosphate isomerase/epimerase family protein n=1 Tax=Natronobiforma cellulositropha TaxID=1679076 RepID=UPI0021D5AC3A|nr:sugar phosphate isomerase/epimerase family protein [Natronobiforma cellulositropha]